MLFVKAVLAKPFYQRTQEEVEEVATVLKPIKFFKERNLKDKDMQELVYAFKLETMDVDEDVMHCGDRGYTFYIILKGQVKVLIPNPLIKNWKQKRYAHQ